MTLIAFHTDRKRARIMTDTWGYTFDLSMRATSKHTVIPHFDMAVAVQGSTGFHAEWVARLLRQATDEGTPDFDALNADTPALLRKLWADFAQAIERTNADEGARGSMADTVVFHIGYSTSAASYVAHAYASEQNFEPIDLTGQAYAMPTPSTVRPGPIEGPRLRRHFAANQLLSDVLETLEAQPPLTAPRNRHEWVALAERIRKDRSECDLWSGFKTYVGGDLHMTTLTPGSAETKRLHTFDSSTETLRRIFAGSMHPLSQNGPCAWCDSGERYIECCLGDWNNGKPCPCGSPDNFEDCCSVNSSNAPAHT